MKTNCATFLNVNAGRLLLVIFSCSLSCAAQAGEVLYSYVDEEDDHFVIQLDMRINAPHNKVYQRLTAYDQLHQLSNTVIKSELMSRDRNQSRVRVITRGCVLFFCREVVQIQTATELGQGYIMLIDDQQESDFEHGHTLWHIREDAGQTRVTLSADLQPRFWIPPLIGTALFKHKLLREGKHLINSLESHVNTDTTPIQ